MLEKNLLVIGHQWPEPRSSAAGVRMMQLLQLFLNEKWNVDFAVAAEPTERAENLETLGIRTHKIALNSSSFDEDLKHINPTIVIYDRFLTEEQFSWRVRKLWKNALTILDTEDLHFLRKARAENSLQNHFYWQNAIALREWASMFRSDITLVISSFEYDWLLKNSPLTETQLMYLPLVYDVSDLQNKVPFNNRKNGVFIGNGKHAPNVDAVQVLYHEWHPRIQKAVPDFETHIYMPYAPQSIKQLHKPKSGFYIMEAADEVVTTLQNYRVLLAPLRFGAGIKGKLVEAMRASTPSITTYVGIEGIASIQDWAGKVVNEQKELETLFLSLYTDEKIWEKAVQVGHNLLKLHFDKVKFHKDTFKKLLYLLENLTNHRNNHFITQVFWQQTLRSTEYMSRWIETKNLLKND